MGHSLTLDEAKEVIESLRVAQGAALLEAANKPRKGSKRPATTDEQLDAELEGLGL